MNAFSKPDQRADQFKGAQCEGTVEIFWNPTGLVGWFWRPRNLTITTAHGPFMTSREALLAAILEGHVHYNEGTPRPRPFDPTQQVEP